MKLITFIIFFVMIDKSLVCQDLLVLQPGPTEGIDAFLSSLDADINYGNHISFYAKVGTRNDSMVIGRSLIKFDLSKIDKNWNIKSAYLDLSYSYLDNSNPPHRGDNSSFLIPVTSPWEEEKVTWNTQPNIDMTNAIKLRASNYDTESFYDIDVTNLVMLGHSDLSKYFGWMLMLEKEVLYTDIKFASSDTPDSNLRPKLKIIYEKVTAVEDQNSNQGCCIKQINNHLNLEFNEKFNSLSIFNLEGKRVADFNITGLSSYELNLSEFQKSLYIIVLQNNKSIKKFKFLNY